MQAIESPLSNLQLEILKAFSHQLNDEDLSQLKHVLADFFAQKAIQAADKVWDEEHWDKEKATHLLQTKLRTPYKRWLRQLAISP